jgi:hypothetical protein
MSELTLPFIASIPYAVQSDDELPDSVKIYFGQIVGLSIKCGYIWATDEQLASMKKTSIKNIERWNRLLEEKGYITRETKNIPKEQIDGKWAWEKKRKIFINEGFQREKKNSKKVYETLKNEGSLDTLKNEGSLDTLKNEGSLNRNSLNSISKQESEEVVVSSDELEKLDIETKLKAKIIQENSPDEIKTAVDRCLKWKSRPSDSVGIMTALKKADSWIDNETPEKIEDKNTAYLKSLLTLDGQKIGVTSIVVCSTYIEFNSGMKTVIFSIDDKEFKKNVIEYIESLRKWVEENKK